MPYCSMLPAEELTRAAAQNHVSWFSDNALVAGGSVQSEGVATVIYSPAWSPDVQGEVFLAFPEGDSVGSVIEDALALAREIRVRQVSCWSLLPTWPSTLAVSLLAQGFSWGWQPHWMALELATAPEAPPTPPGITLALDTGEPCAVTGLPYYDPAEAPRLQAHFQMQPQRTFHFGAWEEGKLVGHSLLHVSADRPEYAGIYNVGVIPEARKRGIGRAVSWAACQWAREQGCRYVLLNAATHIYARLGFVSLGYGQTWWLFPPVLEAPPAPAQVALVEALGRGDLSALASLGAFALDAPLPCKMTPLEVAVRLQQPEAVSWLLAAGATPELIPLWDLGWKEQVGALVRARPALVNQRLLEWSKTPLHEAVWRDDSELVRLLLSAGPDLELRDTQFNGTPLDWAKHLGRTALVELIEKAIPK